MKKQGINKFGALLFAFLCFTGKAQAQDIVLPGCDVAIHTIHSDRAQLEARREVAANQELIVTADSVLEYTCFTDLVAEAGITLSPLFSGTDDWMPKIISTLTTAPIEIELNQGLGPESLSEALDAAVILTASEYIETNFAHSYLGGTGPEFPGGLPCTVMHNVWEFAKSVNFPPPEEWEALPAFPNAVAEGMYTLPPLYNTEYLMPDSPCEAMTIFTGVTTHVSIAGGRIGEIETFADGFCVSPGCYYTMGGDYGGGEGECVR